MYQLNKFKKFKNEKFFKFKDQKIKSQDILQIFVLLMLAIILYYFNWIKWTSNESFNKFISLNKPELDIINEQINSLSVKSSLNQQSKPLFKQKINLKTLFLNHQLTSLNNSSLNNSTLNNNLDLNSNKLNLNPTKATSLQSFYRITDHNLSPNKQIDQNLIKNEFNEQQKEYHSNLDQQEQRSELSEFTFDSTIKTSIHSNLHSIYVLSSKVKVELKIDNQIIYQSTNSPSNRGFHIFVLNQHSLNLMSHRIFDTYSSASESEALNDYLLNKVSKNRLLIFAVQDEASFSLSNGTIDIMNGIGCKLCLDLGWRDMYVLLTLNSFDSKLLIREQLSKNDYVKTWGQSIELDLQVDLENFNAFTSCSPPYDYLDEPIYTKERRIHFCSQIDGYADSICNCTMPNQIMFETNPIPDDKLSNVPVAVIAANRPYYLYSMLNSLLVANGVNKSMITIYIDGFFKEPYEIGKLFDLRVVRHKSVGKGNARISQHYYFSLNELFNYYSTSDFAIIFEEDLIVSPDIFSYFSQTKNLLIEDPSLYCISAFNDNSYVHSSSDEKILYRIEGMPGLGWMLTKKLWINELKNNWPSPKLNYDWDLWMRQEKIRKNRECIIPDVSRTYHLGIKGVNMNREFHYRYFENRALNQINYVNLSNVDYLIELNYELHLLDLIKKGEVINEKINVRSINELYEKENDNLIYNLENENQENLNRNKLTKLNKFNQKKDNENSFCNQLLDYFQKLNSTNHYNEKPAQILYISMDNEQDFDSWLKLANCFSLWDLNGDPRGYHKGLWRFFLNDNHVLVIGYPASPYSVFKKSHIQPILINS